MSMKITPDFVTFESAYNQDTHQLVYIELPADLETPVAVAHKFHDESFCGLFESVEGGANRARYSFIVLRPDLLWKCKDGTPYISRTGSPDDFTKDDKDIFGSFRAVLSESEFTFPRHMPSMAAGLFGFMGYDMVKHMEVLPDANPDTIGIPKALYMRPQIVIIFDSVTDTLTIATPVYHGSHSAQWAYEEATTRLSEIVEILDKYPTAKHYTQKLTEHTLPTVHSNTTREEYHQMVETAKQYTLEGDIFQVVPSQRFHVDFPYSPFALYRQLRTLNPSPFSFYLKMDDFTLVGSSPEILVRAHNGTVTIRPIAGTRKRGVDQQEDEALANDLLQDPKELSEHLMLLDLGRNDVGRVANIGTVEVTQHMSIEYYSHVMHIVSNVQGTLRDDKDALDAFIAGFPAGTVSGAPKIRAMEIIDELEKEKRSFYAGGVGYFSADGNMDSCITLRTGLIKNGTLYVQAGGGVVANSDPEAEYQESCNKARAVLKAAEHVAKRGGA